jgi:glycosyltransferase involved in cell wall biosynthesis
MQPVPILFTIPNFLTAGSGREMMNIIDRLDKDLFAPHIAVAQEGGTLYQEAIRKGYPVIVAPFTAQGGGVLSKLRQCRRMAKGFRKYRFKIWQSFNWSSDYSEAIISRMSGAQYVYVKKNMNWDRRAWKVKTFLASAVIARNKTLLKKHLAAWYFRGKSYLVKGGVSIGSFQKVVSSDLRIKYRIPEDAFVVGCVAQVVRVKDQLTLIKAIIDLPDVFLLLAGAERDGVYADELRQIVSHNDLDNRVFFLGAVQNVNTVLSASDVFVLPTTNRYGHEEGCPVALLEAMAAGLPCIASNVAGSNDLVRHGDTGLLFTPENVQELREQIITLKESPEIRSRFGGAGYQLVARENTLEMEVMGFVEVYKKLIGLQ